MRTVIVTALLIALAATTGCAGQQALRATSASTASVLGTYRQGFSDFAAQQNLLDTELETRLSQFAAMRGQRVGEVETRKLAWGLADDKAAEQRFMLLTQVRAEQILAPGTLLQPAAPAAAPALSYDGASIDALIQKLVALQAKPSDLSQLNDFIVFGAATYHAAVDEATKATTKVTADTTTDAGVTTSDSAKAATTNDQ